MSNNSESFKIGSNFRAGMSAPVAKGGKSNEDLSKESSLGFARIEHLLENEDPTAVGASLNNLLKDLEGYLADASSNKDKAMAQKAIAAVELSVDLVDFLFQTKEGMEG